MTAHPLRDAFRAQGRSCERLGSPFMGRLMGLMADRLTPDSAVARRLLDWRGDVTSDGHSVPLRIAGALHGLVLDGSDPGLAAAYPPHDTPDAALWAALTAAFGRHEARIMSWLDQAPQTNEVRRASALIPAICHALARHDLPVILSELGASAGLNLALDRFGLVADGARIGAGSPVQLAPDWTGPTPALRPIAVAGRAGVDLNPLDPGKQDDRLRLLAYLWPDQPYRIALTEAAIALAETRPEAGDAAPWLAARLARRHPGHLHLVTHTIAWQYFPPATKAACATALAQAGAAATPDAPLGHIALEADGDPQGAALTLRLWPDPEGVAGRPRLLARADFHGRWIDWRG